MRIYLIRDIWRERFLFHAFSFHLSIIMFSGTLNKSFSLYAFLLIMLEWVYRDIIIISEFWYLRERIDYYYWELFKVFKDIRGHDRDIFEFCFQFSETIMRHHIHIFHSTDRETSCLFYYHYLFEYRHELLLFELRNMNTDTPLPHTRNEKT